MVHRAESLGAQVQDMFAPCHRPHTINNLATCFAAPASSSEYATTSPILSAAQQNMHQANYTFTQACTLVASLPIATPTRYPPGIDKLVLPHCRRQLAMLRKASAIRKRMQSRTEGQAFWQDSCPVGRTNSSLALAVPFGSTFYPSGLQYCAS